MISVGRGTQRRTAFRHSHAQHLSDVSTPPTQDHPQLDSTGVRAETAKSETLSAFGAGPGAIETTEGSGNSGHISYAADVELHARIDLRFGRAVGLHHWPHPETGESDAAHCSNIRTARPRCTPRWVLSRPARCAQVAVIPLASVRGSFAWPLRQDRLPAHPTHRHAGLTHTVGFPAAPCPARRTSLTAAPAEQRRCSSRAGSSPTAPDHPRVGAHQRRSRSPRPRSSPTFLQGV